MPQQANIVINDGQATPVAHTFAPDGAYKGDDGKVTSQWVDMSPSVRVGYHMITEQHSAPNSNGVQKIRWKISRVTTETLAGAPAPSRAYANEVYIEPIIHERSTAAETADIVAFAKNFTASAYFATKVNTRERTW